MNGEKEKLISLLKMYAVWINSAPTGYHASVDVSGAEPQLVIRSN